MIIYVFFIELRQLNCAMPNDIGLFRIQEMGLVLLFPIIISYRMKWMKRVLTNIYYLIIIECILSIDK